MTKTKLGKIVLVHDCPYCSLTFKIEVNLDGRFQAQMKTLTLLAGSELITLRDLHYKNEHPGYWDNTLQTLKKKK